MKLYHTALFLFMLLVFMACENGSNSLKNNTYRIARVAFITSGHPYQNGNLPAGVQIASHYFNSHGAVMVNIDRKILLDTELLKTFDVIILSSAAGYHDADRPYSLTFMSDQELNNLESWIKNGGYLIAGDNIGRNNEEGTDRISLYGRLQPDNWPLSRCLGVSLSEKNMKGSYLRKKNSQLPDLNSDTITDDAWFLVADSVFSDKITIWNEWIAGEALFPAFFSNQYGKGKIYLLPSSYYLHPSNLGGFWDVAEIEQFYESVLSDYYHGQENPAGIHPWPEGRPYAFAATINPYGTKNQLESIIRFSKKYNIPLTAVVYGSLDGDIVKMLNKNKINLASSGYKRFNYRDKSYLEAWTDIFQNEQYYQICFQGFRFPFTTPSANGFFVLDERQYQWESGIGFRPDLFSGCLFPYKIPVSSGGVFKTTGITEISPLYHDDYYFLSEIEQDSHIGKNQLIKATALYRQYLFNQLEYSIKPCHGQMTWIGHPAFTAYNDTTLSVLESLYRQITEDKAWLTTPDKITDYRNALEGLQVFIQSLSGKTNIWFVQNKPTEIHDFTLVLTKKPAKISIKSGNYKLKQDKQVFYLIFDVNSRQKVQIRY